MFIMMFIMIGHIDRKVRHRRDRHRSEIFGNEIGRGNVGRGNVDRGNVGRSDISRSDIGWRRIDGCHIHRSFIYGSDVGSTIQRIHFEFLLNQVNINVCPYRTLRHSRSTNGRIHIGQPISHTFYK
jgi:hypothetical protein